MGRCREQSATCSVVDDLIGGKATYITNCLVAAANRATGAARWISRSRQAQKNGADYKKLHTVIVIAKINSLLMEGAGSNIYKRIIEHT